MAATAAESYLPSEQGFCSLPFRLLGSTPDGLILISYNPDDGASPIVLAWASLRKLSTVLARFLRAGIDTLPVGSSGEAGKAPELICVLIVPLEQSTDVTSDGSQYIIDAA